MRECFGVFSEVTEFARPMSRRKATNGRESLLPSLIPDRHQTIGRFESSEPPVPVATSNGNGVDPVRCCTRQRAKQAGATTEMALLEFMAENHLLAKLVFQRIRPRSRSGMIGGQICPPDSRNARTTIAAPNITPLRIACAEAPISVPVPPAVETLFTQLARRRLRGRAAEEVR